MLALAIWWLEHYFCRGHAAVGTNQNGKQRRGAKKPVYDEPCLEFREWANCFVELKGMHRFQDDHNWGYLLLRFRNGEVTRQDIDTINECVVNADTELPVDIKYATYFNQDQDSINAALFEE
jgi:hypothetical protein